MCSVTYTPPTLLVCLSRSASVYGAFVANGAVCVNVLGPEHEALSRLFGGKTAMEDRFGAAEWEAGRSGAPRLKGALVSFDCNIAGSTRVGTHDVLFCEVLGISSAPEAAALVHFDRRYHQVGAPCPGSPS